MFPSGHRTEKCLFREPPPHFSSHHPHAVALCIFTSERTGVISELAHRVQSDNCSTNTLSVLTICIHAKNNCNTEYRITKYRISLEMLLKIHPCSLTCRVSRPQFKICLSSHFIHLIRHALSHLRRGRPHPVCFTDIILQFFLGIRKPSVRVYQISLRPTCRFFEILCETRNTFRAAWKGLQTRSCGAPLRCSQS